MTIVIVFKTGYELKIKCEKFDIKTNLGGLRECTFNGVTENKPIHFDLRDVLCIYRVISDEGE